MALTDVQIRKVAPLAKDYKLSDGSVLGCPVWTKQIDLSSPVCLCQRSPSRGMSWGIFIFVYISLMRGSSRQTALGVEWQSYVSREGGGRVGVRQKSQLARCANLLALGLRMYPSE